MPLSFTADLHAELLTADGRVPLALRRDLAGECGEILEVTLPDGTVNLAVLPARVVSGLLVTSDKAIRVCVGDVAQNQPVTLGAGGVFALLGSAVGAVNACALSYTPGDGSVATCAVLALTQASTVLGCARFLMHPTLAQGLLACWDLDETSGDRVDHIGGLVLHEAGPVAGVPGHVGQAASFSGENNVYLFGVDILPQFELQDFTLAFWVRVEEIPNDRYMMCVCNAREGTFPGNRFLVYLLTNGVMNVELTWGGAAVVSSARPLGILDWTLVTIWHTVSGIDYQLAIQLNQETIITTEGVMRDIMPPASQQFALGAYPERPDEPRDHLIGLIDTTMVWNRALTPEERAVVWNNGKG